MFRIDNIRNKLVMGETLDEISLKVVVYARVSTEHLEQQKSLQNQVEFFREYVKNHVNWVYVGEYVDNGITGTSDIKRENFMKMIDDAKNEKFDLIVTKEISRFSRNTLDSIKYTRELLKYGVAVLFLNDNINTALPDSELRLTIMASMAQDEIRRLSERVKFGMRRAIERGEILGNDMLFGYKKDRNTGNLIVVENEAKIVKMIYELYVIDKLSLSGIARRLNNDLFYTREGCNWCVSTISRMIKNPKYKGFYCGRKSEIIDYVTKNVRVFDTKDWVVYRDNERIPPIVEEELWNRANEKLIAGQRKKRNNYKEKYLYSGKIYCKEHGEVFYRRIFRRNKKDVTWICKRYIEEGKKVCNSANIREVELNSVFRDLFVRLGIEWDKVIKFLMTFYNNGDIGDSTLTLHKLEKEINKIKLKEDRLLELSLDGIITKKEFYLKKSFLEDKISKLQVKRENLLVNDDLDSCDNWTNVMNSDIYLNLMFNKSVELLLNKIVVSKICNTIVLDIYLNYNNDKLSELKYEYQFRRGEDVSSTKRYVVYYQVNLFYSNMFK